MYLIINLAVSSIESPPSTTPGPVRVAYVRVWQRQAAPADGAVNNRTPASTVHELTSVPGAGRIVPVGSAARSTFTTDRGPSYRLAV